MDACNSCGALTTTLRYANNGLAYCPSCMENRSRRCQRCSQYSPSSVMQRHRGRRLCVSCMETLKAEEARTGHTFMALSYPEPCMVCGIPMEGLVHVWNDKPLCLRCLEEAQASWEVVSGKPGKGGTRIKAGRKKKSKKKRKTKRKPAAGVFNPFKSEKPLLEKKPIKLPYYLS